MISRGGYSKRGQLTLFILVSVLLVLSVVLFYYLKGNLLENNIPGSEPTRDEIIECLDFTTKNALYFVSYQGGYNTKPGRVFDFSPTFFPYFYYEGEESVPSLDFIEKEMGEYVKENLGSCLDSLETSGFDVGYDINNVNVEIKKEGVEFVVDDPITLSKDSLSMQIQLSKFPEFYPVKLYDLHTMSEFYVNDLVEDEDYYCITCIARMAEESNSKFLLFPVVDDVYLVMAFEDSIDPLVFNFVTKFKPQEDLS